MFGKLTSSIIIFSFVITIFFGISVNGAELIIKPGDSGFESTGKWSKSSALLSFTGEETLYSRETGATAAYSPEGVDPGLYDVYLYKLVHSSANDKGLRVEVAYDGKYDSLSVDFSKGETGWEYIGTYYFEGVEYEHVKIERTETDESQVSRTCGVKFVSSDGSKSHNEVDIKVSPEKPNSEKEESRYKGIVQLRENETELISALGLFDKISLHNSDEYRFLTRAEFLSVTMNLIGFEDTSVLSGESEPFSDIPKEHWAFANVSIAQNLGIISGSGTDGSFNPDDIITYEQALAVLVRLLGYKKPAEQLGGYPGGYMITAHDKGMLKGLNLKAGDDIDITMAMRLIYNSLEIDLMKKTPARENDYYIDYGKTLLTEYYGMEKSSGILQTVGSMTTESGRKVSEGMVMIDEVTYASNANILKCLGCSVTFYYTDDGYNKEIKAIYITPNRNEIKVIKSRDIIEAKETAEGISIRYMENGNYESKELFEQAKKVLYNNGLLMEYMASDFHPSLGTVTLIDNNNDGVYDIAFIKNYKIYVAGAANSYAESIFVKYGKGSLNLGQSNIKKYSIKYADGTDAKIEDINEWDILCVLETTEMQAERIYEVIIVRESFNGKVTEVGKDEIIIDGAAYELSESYIAAAAALPEEAPEIKLYSEGTFYKDIDGKIAAFNPLTNEGEGYAYAYKLASEKGLSGKAKLKMLLQSNKWETLKIADKLSYNGSRINSETLKDDETFVMPNDGIQDRITIIEPGESGFSSAGSWYSSSSVQTPSGKASLYSRVVGSTATYSAEGLQTGKYDVYLYKLMHSSNNDPNVSVSVAHKNGVFTTSVNFAVGAAGWEYLGEFNFSQGQSEGVTIEKLETADNIITRTGGVKFILSDSEPVLTPEQLYLTSGLQVLRPIYYELNSDNEINLIEVMEESAETAVRRYKSTTSMFLTPSNEHAEFLVNNNTIIFSVPIKPKEEEKYSTFPKSGFVNDTSYSLAAYEMGDIRTPKVLVGTDLFSSSVSLTSDQNIILVDRVVVMVDERGEALQKLYGMQGGSRVEFVSDSSNVFTNLQRGDVILINKNNEGNVNVKHIMHSSENTVYGQNGSMMDRFAGAYGVLTGMYNNGDILLMSFDGSMDKENSYLYVVSNPRVYICNMSRNVTAADMSELAIGDKIFVRFRISRGQEIVIYRD
ncbi:MAG: S-layer homology domain-containing protein [Firmicutes bacterium]|nr:S-layer homology domain-containing protein [Bacillota bacterium]